MRNSCMASTETNPLVPPPEVKAGVVPASVWQVKIRGDAKVRAYAVHHPIVRVLTLSVDAN